MAKQDFIPAGIQPFMVWHDQFKTAVLANATTFGLVAGTGGPVWLRSMLAKTVPSQNYPNL